MMASPVCILINTLYSTTNRLYNKRNTAVEWRLDYVVQNRVQWWALVNMVMNFWVP
jgi:hypothetical protein